MKVIVDICYDAAERNHMIEVEVKQGLKGVRLMNAIEKAVEKKMKADLDWKRWNLLRVAD